MRPAAGTVGPLPRELSPGLFWFGECTQLTYGDTVLHVYNSAYLVAGANASVLVETGPPAELAAMQSQLDDVLATDVAPLRYIFVTHPETNHAGGTARLLARFPDASLVGDPTDLHLYHPEGLDRYEDLASGEPLDLGGRRFTWVPSIFRDHRSTRWGFDDGSRVLFTADGLAYTHYHMAGHCGHTAEEAAALDVREMVEIFSMAAFPWTRAVDLAPYVARLDDLLDKLEVRMIAPTHGLPIADLPTIMPKIRAGMLGGARRAPAPGTERMMV